MKKPEAETKAVEAQRVGNPKLQRADSQAESEVDVIAEQLKFPGLSEDPDDRAAYAGHRLRVDGGKLRFQLYKLAGEGESSHAYDLQL
ncbi:hypothetical protein KUCAC02_001841 [Chaenocephalus aceratus]|uniref:Uncharacterized protein n=1 Tax=Chaenocephalus aceratus TaxID=36190 RepID=A0ACB9XTV9_CHAAC|nr:hypothetical protein KUCAC02_001841 [Chaenocephalus aceratus]